MNLLLLSLHNNIYPVTSKFKVVCSAIFVNQAI